MQGYTALNQNLSKYVGQSMGQAQGVEIDDECSSFRETPRYSHQARKFYDRVVDWSLNVPGLFG